MTTSFLNFIFSLTLRLIIDFIFRRGPHPFLCQTPPSSSELMGGLLAWKLTKVVPWQPLFSTLYSVWHQLWSSLSVLGSWWPFFKFTLVRLYACPFLPLLYKNTQGGCLLRGQSWAGHRSPTHSGYMLPGCCSVFDLGRIPTNIYPSNDIYCKQT